MKRLSCRHVALNAQKEIQPMEKTEHILPASLGGSRHNFPFVEDYVQA